MDREHPWHPTPALLLGMAMSGCLGGGSTVPLGDSQPAPAAPVLHLDAEHGALQGFVYDVELVPIPGVQLTLLPGTRSAATDASGRFAFDRLAPGPYELYLHGADYLPAARALLVEAGRATDLNVQLEGLAKVQPRIEHRTAKLFISCGLGLWTANTSCGSQDKNQKLSTNYTASTGLTTLVVSAQWKPVQATGSLNGSGYLIFQLARTPGYNAEWITPPDSTTRRIDWENNETSYSYSKGRWQLTVLPSRGNASKQYRDNSGLIFAQEVLVYITAAYYGAPIEKGFTGLPD